MKSPLSAESSVVGAGVLLVFVTALISGVSTFVNTYAVAGTSSDAFVTVRNLAVAGLLVPIALLVGRRSAIPLRRVDYARLGIIGLIGGAIPFLLFFHGLQLAAHAGGSATAAFGYRTLFLMTVVLGVVVLGERLHRRIVLAAGLLLAGSALLLSLNAPIWTDGTAFVLAATVLWAAEYTVSKRTLRDLPSVTVALGRMGIGGAFLAVYLGLTAQWGAVGTFSGLQWEWVAISTVLLGAFVLTWYSGLQRVDLGVATSVLVLGFPISWALGLALRGGPLQLPQAIGATIVVIGVVLAAGLALLQESGSFIARALRGPAVPP